MILKKTIQVCLIAIMLVICSSCNKENSASNNSNLQETTNTINSAVKNDDTKEEIKEVKTTEIDTIISTVDLTDSELQQIINNNEFMNSFEGTQYQISSYYFVKAFLNGDYTYITENIIDKSNLSEYEYKDQFSKIECMYFRLREYDKEEQKVHGEYAIQLSKDHGYFYLEYSMQLIDSKWKIIEYLLDA